MKSTTIFLCSALLLSGCSTVETAPNSEVFKACGVENPAQNLPWLKELIAKAEADIKTKEYKGNYIGQIYLTTWRNQDAFWTNFMMGSGGIYARLYHCDGQRIMIDSGNLTTPEVEELNKALNKDKLIYTNMPL